MIAETILDRIELLRKSDPTRVFCTFLEGGRAERITREDMYRRSHAYAVQYRALGIGIGDLVLIVLKHTPHQFYSFIGAMMAGAIPSFMPFPTPKQRADLYWADHKLLFERIRPRLIVSYKDNIRDACQHFGEVGIQMLVADETVLCDDGELIEHEGLSADSVACLQHSSGTTGLKKGVMLTHRAILAQIDSYSDFITFTASDSIVSWLPLYHDMGFIACFLTSIIRGSHLIALDPFEWVMRPLILLDAIESYRATFCWLPNFAFAHIANHARPGKIWDLRSMRAFINCSEPCKPRTFARFAKQFADSGVTREMLQVCYAMAENVFGVTQTLLGRAVESEWLQAETERATEVLCCGRPLSGVEIEIRDAGGSRVKDGIIGEIFLWSRFLFDGYYRQSDITAASLRQGWFRTGDLGWLRDGKLFVTGRTDDMLILNGRNYYAHELEAIASEVPGVLPGRTVAFTIDEHRTDATAIVLLVECKSSCERVALKAMLRRALLEALGLALHAVVLVVPGTLVKTTSGKISREANRRRFLDGDVIPI